MGMPVAVAPVTSDVHDPLTEPPPSQGHQVDQIHDTLVSTNPTTDAIHQCRFRPSGGTCGNVSADVSGGAPKCERKTLEM